MLKLPILSAPPAARNTPVRAVRPALENLEGRLLLYSTLGAQWTYDSRITYSFMPDGTSVGGTPSVLFHTLNAVAPTSTWEAQFEQAASLWETAANVNLALVPDGGEPVGTNGDQQDDPRFGDIRIGAVPLSSGILAETFVPPPINGGTDAGDILFNSNASWAVNNTYDVMTVAAHEFGHALGLGESTNQSAVMYGTYNGIKQALISDDISGIDSIYGAQPYDRFNNSGSRNTSFFTATNLTPDINYQDQVALSGLDNTTPSDDEWYSVTVPASTTGQMTVSVQSSNLSSFAPGLMVYNSSLSLVSQVASTSPAGVTISTTLNVASGQKYYFKVLAGGSVAPVGAYGLLANFGSQSQSPIPPPDTVVPQQPDEAGSTMSDSLENPGGSTTSDGILPIVGGLLGAVWSVIGNLSGWAVSMSTSTSVLENLLNLLGTAVAPATQTSVAPSNDTSSMAALPSFSTTATAPTLVGLTDDSSSAEDSTSVAATPLPTVEVVFQAVDAVLGGWKGRHRRPATEPHQKHHY